MFKTNNFALAAGFSASIIFFVSHLIMWMLYGGGVMRVEGEMQLMNQGATYFMGMCRMSLMGMFLGILFVFLITFIWGWLFAWVYNKLEAE